MSDLERLASGARPRLRLVVDSPPLRDLRSGVLLTKDSAMPTAERASSWLYVAVRNMMLAAGQDPELRDDAAFFAALQRMELTARAIATRVAEEEKP